MEIIKTKIKDLLLVEPKVWGDERGYFFESYNAKHLSKEGIDLNFIQDNEAKSSYGVLRGMHYQLPPFGQSKLVRVVQGEVLDVVIDIREGSKSYGKSYQVILSAHNKKQLLVPKGFAHGYLTLSETAIFCYKCDQYYNKEHESGIVFDSSSLEIKWPIDRSKMIISEKDLKQPNFGDHKRYI